MKTLNKEPSKGNTWTLTKSQTKFFTDMVSKAIAFSGGYGAGKSFVLTGKMLGMKLCYPETDLLYLTPVFSNFRDILIPTITEILQGTNIEYEINKTTGEIVFGVGGRIIVKSMDDPSKIIGFNVSAVFFDELDTLPTNKAREVWQKAIARARKPIFKKDLNGNLILDENGEKQKAINQLFVATTPEGFRFTYEMFKKNKPDNYTLITAHTAENIHLPPDYVDNLKAIYPENVVGAYLRGEFVNLTSGSVFSSYDRFKNDTTATYKQSEKLLVGIDFNVLGINAVIYVERESLNQTNEAVEGYAYNDKPTLHAIDHLQKINDTPDLIRVLKNKYPSSQIVCYPDASGKNVSTKGATVSDISILKQAGFQCKHPKKNPNILDRVKAANSAFKNKLVRVNQNKCPDLVEAFEQQVYNDKTELPEKNSGAGTIDDITDSATYIIHFLYPIKKRSMGVLKYKETGS